MARPRTSMKKIREIIRLKSTTSLSDREISRALQVARPVVAKYWKQFSESGLPMFPPTGRVVTAEMVKKLEEEGFDPKALT